MYRDLRRYFWWNNIKKKIDDYVDKSLTYQEVKAEHQHPLGELRPLEIPSWKMGLYFYRLCHGFAPFNYTKKNAI